MKYESKSGKVLAGITGRSRGLVLIFIATLCCGGGALRAAAILDLTLDDPKKMIKKSDGIFRATEDFSNKNATLASGKGGRVLPGFNEGPEGAVPDAKGKPTSEARLLAPRDNTFGTTAYMRATLSADPVTRNVGIRIIPDSSNESVSALFSFQNDRGSIDGVIDFFFCATSEGGGFPKMGFRANCGPMGFDITSDPLAGGMILRAYTNDKSVDSNGDGTADKEMVSGKSAKGIILESGAIYHGAIVFHTTSEGRITWDYCLQKGTGPMKIADTVVASVRNFGLRSKEPRGTDDQDLITLYLGKTKFAQSLDLAAFRIYKTAPAILPGIDGKE